jgi:hypothetical protein
MSDASRNLSCAAIGDNPSAQISSARGAHIRQKPRARYQRRSTSLTCSVTVYQSEVAIAHAQSFFANCRFGDLDASAGVSQGSRCHSPHQCQNSDDRGYTAPGAAQTAASMRLLEDRCMTLTCLRSRSRSYKCCRWRFPAQGRAAPFCRHFAA